MFDKLKGALRSKTIWFNVVFLPGLAGVLDQVHAHLADLQPYVPANTMQVIAVVSVVGNIALRAITTQPLETK